MVDLVPGGSSSYTLDAPTRDASPASTLLFPDVMRFTANGLGSSSTRSTQLPLPGGGSQQRWSIYRVELGTGDVLDVVPPLFDANFDFPALSARPATTSSRSTR